ncbi:hypothetical protein AJ85_13495 [Alkalihalobacillus alcalophilus ATCC 27647 = CGMCC 1.3604]|uniref:Peptide ABC transporter permease n=1 Tax=Alkalihalobacillus alcalophilus ATCC 27647 = CGMCC 1.3604 TaxID=1218173 RepID=A0A094WE87_ALKAL|nr:anti-sigma-F factor Fin family protein [Alkalihalobacillus alcalophilus]KGA96069.1 peptide ABC transporter permease [Alkalihalobacillus alcalophilus ATCC 27647 = CGMCC 1.3604]MED1562403.1 anti-sigma-F factor Fin family protein [Alkalihalobacillus alcalophilus]THG90069.1 hypothetical protein AJ85_13495 [Alkalihalobacillus alcalophilus ATCC 27647 = CGMCC 1.3604]
MAIFYQCRHCDLKIGQIDEKKVDSSTLGFDQLNSEERENVLAYQTNGDIQVKTICEDCFDALTINPTFHEIDSFIQ